jgi:hypothetical protein
VSRGFEDASAFIGKASMNVGGAARSFPHRFSDYR